jgi:serine/threonine protein kinase
VTGGGTPRRVPCPADFRYACPTLLAIKTGTRIGSYEIVSPLGSGGMGEVWRAHDTRIDRDVAIKVLPEELAADADRLARFELEARAAGALNHPNILTVFEMGTLEGHPYLVTELLQGATLRE